MGVELEYFYSLYSKTLNSYNFTQPPRIKLWWFQSIKKQTNKFLKNKTMNNKKIQNF
jgi:hypothetical protein